MGENYSGKLLVYGRGLRCPRCHLSTQMGVTLADRHRVCSPGGLPGPSRFPGSSRGASWGAFRSPGGCFWGGFRASAEPSGSILSNFSECFLPRSGSARRGVRTSLKICSGSPQSWAVTFEFASKKPFFQKQALLGKSWSPLHSTPLISSPHVSPGQSI